MLGALYGPSKYPFVDGALKPSSSSAAGDEFKRRWEFAVHDELVEGARLKANLRG